MTECKAMYRVMEYVHTSTNGVKKVGAMLGEHFGVVIWIRCDAFGVECVAT